MHWTKNATFPSRESIFLTKSRAFTVYGDSVVKSIKEVAQSIKDAGGAAYEDNKEYIDSILA